MNYLKKRYWFITLLTVLILLFIFLIVYRPDFLNSISGRLNQGTISLFVEGADNQAPNVNVTYPLNGQTYSSHRTELNYTVSDNFELGICWYSLDSGATNISVSCGTNVSSITSSEGNNTWKVYANDTTGNENSSSVTFSVSSSVSSPSGGSSGGGGGGGDYSLPLQPLFEVNPEELNIFMVAGETGEGEIFVKNLRNSGISLIIEVTGFNEFASLSTNEIYLAPGESKSVLLFLSIDEPGVYAGKVMFNFENNREEVFVLVNVRDGEALFDVSLTIPDSFKVIFPGESLKAFTSLLQLGSATEVDVIANYLIKDFTGNTFIEESETFRVYGKKDVVKEFDQLDLPSGDYIVAIEILYPGGFAASSAHFKIKDRINLSLVLLGFFALLVVLAIIWSLLTYKKSKRYIRSKRVK